MTTDDKSVLAHFFIGIVMVIVIQTVFMLGGLVVEKQMEIPITGIPSGIGLTVVLVAGAVASRKLSSYVLLGSFTLAFISPLILLLIIIFKAMEFTAPHLYYAVAYLVVLCIAVWGHFVIRILKRGL